MERFQDDLMLCSLISNVCIEQDLLAKGIIRSGEDSRRNGLIVWVLSLSHRNWHVMIVWSSKKHTDWHVIHGLNCCSLMG